MRYAGYVASRRMGEMKKIYTQFVSETLREREYF
jgi:hypothetical protein